MALEPVQLGDVGSEALRSAVVAVIRSQAGDGTALPSTRELEQGARAAVADDESALEASRRFQAILEIAYLVASADGFAPEESAALADLLSEITGGAIDRDALRVHFADLEDACAMLGRRERLRRSAAEFGESIDRSEAMAFAALVASADGTLADPEIQALTSLGGDLGLDDASIEAAVRGVVTLLRLQLASEAKS